MDQYLKDYRALFNISEQKHFFRKNIKKIKNKNIPCSINE